MTIGLWGFADASAAVFPYSAPAPGTPPAVPMFPIIPHHVGPNGVLKGAGSGHGPSSFSETSLSSSPRSPKSPRSSATPPSPPGSPVLSAGGCFRLGTSSPPLSSRSRATSTPILPSSGSSPSPSPAPAPAPIPAPGAPTDGVFAEEDIVIHAVTKGFRPAEVFDGDLNARHDALSLRLSAEGFLEARARVGDSPSAAPRVPQGADSVGPRWVRRARLADDCHSVNVQVQRDSSSGRVRVRAVRALKRGQKLQMWFADDLLADLRLPFLAPHNIQGEKRYVCHRCGRTFEYPNPLKLHLSLDCGRECADELWRRLSELESPAPAAAAANKSSAFRPYWSTSCSSSSASDSGLGSLSLSLSSSTCSNTSLFQSFQQFSLMAAALPLPLPLSLAKSVPSPHPHPHPPHLFARGSGSPTHAQRPPPRSPQVPGHAAAHPHPHPPVQAPAPAHAPAPPQEPLALLTHTHNPVHFGQHQREMQHQHQVQADISSYHQHASDMETLVSNLGRSKQGHLCIYCGKVYSRKYGLKIHIRTHTGFKPLKCKYCLRPFGDPSNLNKHVRLHAEGDTPYKCDLCGKVLVRRRDLERHVKSRHQEGGGLGLGGDWEGEGEVDNETDDIEVDVDDDTNDEDEQSSTQAVLCNGNSLAKGRPTTDIPIPTV